LNISSAAVELGMSQPAASLQLKRLEEEFKIQFYTRNNSGVSLTPEGQAFLDAVRPILVELDKVDQAFRAKNERPSAKPFVVGSSDTLLATVLPRILLEFKRRRPDVDLLVETTNSQHMSELVQEKRVEVAVITTPYGLSDCECEPYIEHEAVVFTTPDNALADRTLSLAELARIPLVVRRDSAVIVELERMGYSLTFAAQFSAIEAVKTAVRGGMGAGILFRSRLEPELARGEVKIIDVPDMASIKLKSFIIYAKRPRLSDNAREFLEILRDSRDWPKTYRSKSPAPLSKGKR
jgi:DNA-binding transcriptional LysR family regulator